ncbi:hypothetical protein BDP27DRAFT_765682 [Rhodocollybia butyracea]|uniref:Uncharacterized protein n=1 Tax=Rhodocollybia butyracea TaxID=206335 RepID=A0A9P5PTJ6_9AGAR|nr:hypothetical protein BDP27DRAFT_765682 [Rhodocollybia butyracea]
MVMDPRREMEDVYRCLRILGIYEKRYQIAGRMRDILIEIVAAQPVEVQFGSNLGSRTKKREREDQGENRHTMTPTAVHASESDESNGFFVPSSYRDALSRFSKQQCTTFFLVTTAIFLFSYPPAQTAAQAEFLDPPMSSTAHDQVMPRLQ